jgi:hypothetical protein
MKIAYTHLGNIDSFKSRRYQPGDRLICYGRACEVAVGETATSVAERMFALHSGGSTIQRRGVTRGLGLATCL